ncbi:MAG: hypothetical protein BWY77_01621 [bacterium ADurb.Bin431]|nr:MAG: hypothetical protein BWY77_01621 [bacterium ADurb.Bin431]
MEAVDQQGRIDALTSDVGDDQGEAAAGEGDNLVIVTANLTGGDVQAAAPIPGDLRKFGGENGLLDNRGKFDLTQEALLFDHLVEVKTVLEGGAHLLANQM